ncbi:MAG: alpha/beta hydrolase [Myxococcales bacterium]|nr:alpha/beta hydrolase [Myxococcales bacterium]
MSRRRDPLRHRIASSVVRTLFHAPAAWLARLAPRRPADDPLDPRLAFLLHASNRLRLDELTSHDPVKARRRTRRSLPLLAGPRRPLTRVHETTFAGPGGPLRLRIYEPHKLERPAPALLYIHGGGWVIGDLDTHDSPCSRLAELGQCVVLSLEYRLAPEHKFPAAVDDALAAFRWLADHTAELNLDPTRLAVAGDSAGGNLSTVIAQTATRERWPVRPCFQLLLYPGLDFRRGHASHRSFADGYLLTAASIDWFMKHYLRGPDDIHDLRVSPLLAPDLAGLPPAYISTAGFDPLRDEAHEYADRLRAAGVPVELAQNPSLVHGFIGLVDAIPAAAAALDHAALALHRALHRQ